MKTSKEFDYNLWAIEENGSKRYFCRIKATGEECEISLECMRVLLSEDKKIKRYYEKLAEYGSILSLDVYSESEDAEKLCWQVDTTDMVEEVIADMLEAEFIKELSERQLDVYLHSILMQSLPVQRSDMARTSRISLSLPMNISAQTKVKPLFLRTPIMRQKRQKMQDFM